MLIWVYTSGVKTNGRSLSVLEYKKYLYYVQIKICMYLKRVWYVQRNNYVHKRMFFLYVQGKNMYIKECCWYVQEEKYVYKRM